MHQGRCSVVYLKTNIKCQLSSIVLISLIVKLKVCLNGIMQCWPKTPRLLANMLAEAAGTIKQQ